MSEVKKVKKPVHKPLNKETNPMNVLFEKMRVRATPLDQRQKYMQQALEAMGEKIGSFVNSPVHARVLEQIVKNGTPEQYKAVYAQLEDKLSSLMGNKYSRFVVADLLNMKRHPETEAKIREIITAEGEKLTCNASANIALNMIYSAASPAVQEFTINQLVTKKAVDDADYAVAQVRQMPQTALVYAENVYRILEKCERKMMLGSIVCIDVLLRLYQVCFALRDLKTAAADEIYAQINEKLIFLTSIEVEQFLQLIDTEEGAEVAAYVFAQSGAKQKKQILQQLKPKFQEVMEDGCAGRFLAAAAPFVDDTKTVNELVLEPAKKLVRAGALGVPKSATRTHLELLFALCTSQLVPLAAGEKVSGL